MEPERMESGLAALEIGDEVTFSKTVGETDIYLFAGVTGDFYEAHVNEQAMRSSRFGTRIAHGALVVGFMSTTAGMMIARPGELAVSLGYDRVRFNGSGADRRHHHRHLPHLHPAAGEVEGTRRSGSCQPAGRHRSGCHARHQVPAVARSHAMATQAATTMKGPKGMWSSRASTRSTSNNTLTAPASAKAPTPARRATSHRP